MERTAVILHGSFGKPSGNWFPWLGQQLEDLDVRVVIPTMPTPLGQNLDNWLRCFEEQVGSVDAATLMIGHSLSVAFILRLIEARNEPVFGSVLVSGFLGLLGLPEFDEVNKTFTVPPFDWAKVNRNKGSCILLAGEGDPYVPMAKGLELAGQLNTPVHVIPSGMHLNADAGFTTFPYLLRCIEDLLARE